MHEIQFLMYEADELDEKVVVSILETTTLYGG